MFFKRLKNRLCCTFATSFLFIFCPIVMSQTVITGSPGYTNVDNPVGTTVYNITSNKPFNGGAAILNRFTSFVLDNNHTANIILGIGVQTSVNVVNNPLNTPTTINGILNHIAGANPGSPTGGNFIFIDPNGFMLGGTGQINAGSILLSTSSSTLAPFIGGGQIDFNDPAQDHLLAASVVDINGQFSFVNMSGVAQIDGVMNTMNGNALAAISPGVSVFADAIYLGDTGMIFARNQTAVNLVTAKNVNYTFTSNNTSVQAPLDSCGNLEVAGQVKNIDGKVLISSNSLDLANNMINLTGIVDASSLSHNRLGDVTLRSGISDQSSGEISLNGAQVSASRNININTRKAVNVNGAGTILNAGNSLLISGNGMYLNGTYQTTQGNITINNPGTNPVLIDADMTSQLGGIRITTDGPVVLDYAESLLPPAVIPPNDQVSMALGNVEIMSNGFTSYASIISQGGNVVIESLGDAAFTGHCGVTAQGLIDVLANTIMVNQPFNAINGDVNLNTRTGDIFVGVAGSLSSLNAAVNIYRTVANNELRFTANGVISAENVANGLVIGDPPANISNGGSVVLDGSSFGAYSGTYTNSTTVPKNAQFDPNMQVNNFAVNIFGTTPSPVNPPAPPAPPAPIPSSTSTNSNNNGSSNNNSNDQHQEGEEYFNNLAQENLQTALNNTGTSELDVWSFPTTDPTAPAIAFDTTPVKDHQYVSGMANEFDSSNKNDAQIVVDEYGNPQLVYAGGNNTSVPVLSSFLSVNNGASQYDNSVNKLPGFLYVEPDGYNQKEYSDSLRQGIVEENDYNWITLFWSTENAAQLEKQRLLYEKNIAWEGEKEAFNDYFNNEREIDVVEGIISKYQKEYKESIVKAEAYNSAEEAYEKAHQESLNFHLSEFTSKRYYAGVAYSDALEAHKNGKISDKELQQALDKCKEAERLSDEAHEAYAAKVEERKEYLSKMINGDSFAESRATYAKSRIEVYSKKVEELKAKRSGFMDNYNKALENYHEAEQRYNNAVTDQEVRVDNGGSISVNGNQQSMGLSPIQYGADGKPVWGVTDYTGRGQPTSTTQSLNPRSALLMRGRTPATETQPETSQLQGGEFQGQEPVTSGTTYVQSDN